MHESPASRKPASFIPLIFTAIFCLPLIILTYLLLHGPGLESRILPPEAAQVVRDFIRQTRSQLLYGIPYFDIKCELGDICLPGSQRPLLPDGSQSRPVWDLPRKLMKNQFKGVREKLPSAKVNYIWKEPLVVYYDDVLTDAEIKLLIVSAEPRFRKSMVVGPNGKPQEDKTRNSDTAWIYMTEDKAYEKIVDKIAALAGFTYRNSEHIAVNRYGPSQYFHPHHDFLQEDQLFGISDFKGCQRASTALVYLSDVEEGGETMFTRNLDMDGRFNYDPRNPNHLKITPKRGRVLIWYNMHPYTEKVDRNTLHGGSPVVKGTKIAATMFIRNCTRQSIQNPQPTPLAQVSSIPQQPKQEL